MSDEVERFRLAVVQKLERMSQVEDQLRVEAEERGEDDLEAIHEHGAVVLRVARNVIARMSRE